MKKRLVLAVMLLLVAAVVADAAVVKVKVATANVRSKPDLMAPVISRVSQGALFEVQKKMGTWYEISVVDNAGNIVTGYINADMVEEVGAAGAAPATAPAQPAAPTRVSQPTASSAGYAASGAAAAGGFFLAAGPVLSNLSVSNEELGDTKKSPRFGLAAGVGYEMPLGGGLSVAPFLMFTTGGNVYSAGSDKIRYVANALALPVLFKYSFGGGPYAALGPSFALVMSPKIKYDIGGETGEEAVETSTINTFQIGLVLGIGYEMTMGASKVGIQAAYSLGMTKLNKEGEDSIKPNGIYILGLFRF